MAAGFNRVDDYYLDALHQTLSNQAVYGLCPFKLQTESRRHENSCRLFIAQKTSGINLAKIKLIVAIIAIKHVQVKPYSEFLSHPL
jgi:hypothetical protein